LYTPIIAVDKKHFKDNILYFLVLVLRFNLLSHLKTFPFSIIVLFLNS